MRVGLELLDLARSTGARTVFVVGTGRNVGKTVALRAIYEAACAETLRTGLASIGRDSEAGPGGELKAKPRLWLRPSTVLVTARALLPRSPASEILKLSGLRSAAGELVYARVVTGAFYELAGPPTASGAHETIDELLELSEIAIVDGAVDRVAALAGRNAAIVVACGAAAAHTPQEAVDEVAAFVARLSIAPFDPREPTVEIEGALTAGAAAAFIAAGETRQIVVGDPTQIALRGKAATTALARLRVRCRRPLRVVAVTVASIGPQRTFEPRGFAGAVAAATGLPAFDVYASAAA